MKVLIIGSGGREHALAWKLDQSKRVSEIFLAPGNAGTAASFQNIDLNVLDFEGILSFCKAEGVNWVVVGPEKPLAQGITDELSANGINVFGPNKACAQFEKSKDFTKKFLSKYGIPTARYQSTTNYEEAVSIASSSSYPLVIKANGLCAGKGVVIVDDFNQAQEHLYQLLIKKRFGNEGELVVIEEYLNGVEQSLLCFVSRNKIIPMETAQDYKKAFDGDQGPNTGGMGAISPSPLVDTDLEANIQKLLKKIETGLDNEGLNYNGVLFIGFMIKNQEPKVLEFNVRFGDPEAEVLLPRLESDLFEIMEKTIQGSLIADDLTWSKQASVGVVLCSEGYPASYEKGLQLKHMPLPLQDGAVVFHNGTALGDQGAIYTDGGRVVTPVALADNLEAARKKAYQTVEKIAQEGLVYRSDIGKHDKTY